MALNAVTLNQDNVVMDGHHKMRACKELGFPVTSTSRNFRDSSEDGIHGQKTSCGAPGQDQIYFPLGQRSL
jgi:hypothetical protein